MSGCHSSHAHACFPLALNYLIDAFMSSSLGNKLIVSLIDCANSHFS